MSDSERYRILGGPGSPYSLKLRAVLRYRRIAHDWLVPPGSFFTSEELRESGKDVLPVLRYPDGAYHTDSTALILDLERRHAGRSALPDDPVHAFLARLIEDMADEWLVYTMFDFRWRADVDVRFCSRRQLAGWMGAGERTRLDALAEQFSARQKFVRELVCGGQENAPVYERTYQVVLDTLERMLEKSLFLFGSRPSLADFGLFGPLSQCAVDPTASRLMRERAIRVYQWVKLVDDASGLDGSWQPDAEPSESVMSLLGLAGDVYLPFVSALATAFADGAAELSFAPWSHPFVLRLDASKKGKDRSGLGYKLRCLGWLKAEFARLDSDARARLEPVLRKTNCWNSLQGAEQELCDVAALVPG